MNWKKIFIQSVGIGTGVTITLVIFFTVWAWYTSRVTPPKAWDSKAVTAVFDEIGVRGNEHNLTFYYTLQNNTDSDYKLSEGDLFHVSAKLGRTDSFSAFDKNSSVPLPIFLPAHKRVRLPLDISYSYPKGDDTKTTPEQRRAFRDELKNYVTTELPNLDGFVLFDESTRYEIDFPSGWKATK